MVDFFLLLMLAGAGDELQGIKKGIMELADAIVINKADGDNVAPAHQARAEYNRAVHYLAPATQGWQTKAYTCSALNNDGVAKIWAVIEAFRQQTTASGVFENRRRAQMVDWVHSIIKEQLLAQFYSNLAVQQALPGIEADVANGVLPATSAVKALLNSYEKNKEDK